MDVEAAASRKAPRTRSIRRRIAFLLVIPLVSLIGLWGFSASLTLGAALNKFKVATVYNKLGAPGSYLDMQLQAERALSALVVGSQGHAGLSQLTKQRALTNTARAAFLKDANSGSVRDAGGAAVSTRLNDLTTQLLRLESVRQDVDAAMRIQGPPDLVHTISVYNDISDSALQLFQELELVNDLSIFKQGSALIVNGYSFEFIMRENALMTGVLASSNPRLTQAEHALFIGWVATSRQLNAQSLSNMSPKVSAPFTAVLDSPGMAALRSIEDSIVNSKPGGKLPASAENWESTSNSLLAQWGNATNQAGKIVADQAIPISNRIMIELIVAGGLGLIAVAASIFMSVVFVRRVSQELGGVQQAAQRLAEDRLPRVVARLRRGENVDVAAEAPPLAVGRTTEINRVAEAFSKVQHTAIDTAVGEAYLRKGISRVFLNLAWRSQSLLHRQLRMLDSMERRASGPEELEDLFRLDHLTTRMRRHAEGLVILSGAPPSRGWNQPVLLIDVLRGAVAEVEDYTRVDVVTSSSASLTGAAVADVIHLLAELIENATAFSPPPTEVLVRGEMVANGFAIEVIDRGIGLSPEELSELNERLARPPEFDLADSDRLGLFVVSRLAARHGIAVTLQQSAYGGTTAVALVPNLLVVSAEELDEAMPGTDAVQRPRAWFEPRQQQARQLDRGAEERPPVPDPVRLQAVTWESAEPVTEPVPEVALNMESSRDSSEETGRLPRRVRQANLVPQLRGAAEPVVEPEAEWTVDDTTEDDAEAARDLMSSLQSGWLMGRDEDEEPGDGIPPERRNEWGDS